jgi:DNA-binding XRE family transcriptional regulator
MRGPIADWSAGVVAVIVLALGGLVVVKPAIDHWDDLYRSTPFEVGRTTQTVEKRTPGERTETTTVTTEASSSFAERLLGRSGVVLLRLGIVVLLAFLAAALVQRAIHANYALRAGAPAAAAPAAAGHAFDRSPRTADVAGPNGVSTHDGDEAVQEPTGANLAPGIAKLVASRREALGLSQRELAKRAGISHTVISRIEGGEHSPSPKTLERLADALR